MKHQFVRAAAASPELRVADPAYNAKIIIEIIKAQAKRGTEILAFPELSLCGYTCGDLLLNKTLTDGCLAALKRVAEATAGIKMLVFAGVPVVWQNKLYNCAAGISNGKVLGFVPKTHLPNYGEFYERRYFAEGFEEEGYVPLWEKEFAPISSNFLFEQENGGVSVACEICEDLWAADSPSVRHVKTGAEIIVNLSASSETVGKREYRHTLVSAQSGKNVCGYIYCDAGLCESTTDTVFAGNHMIYENGALLAEAKPFSGEVCEAEIDLGFLKNERKRLTDFPNLFTRGSGHDYFTARADFLGEGDLTLRKFSRTPFVPEETELSQRCELILNIQSHALARRLKHVNAKTAVLGISGGLDSTLALLVAVRAFGLAGLPRKDIIAVTMPCFGTTEKTKNNSLLLMEALGVSARTVEIGKTVLSHFKDIGQDPQKTDAAYENAQARYRTMVLMDIANQTNGLVAGTGDMSELALGWCTYNGDHMSNYAVNSSVPKTLVKALVGYEAERLGGELKSVLMGILNTEISPELLPPEKDGSIAQKTEDIVGPYDLQDFYLYHFLRRGDSPAKTLYLAERTFAGKYERATLKKWLLNFYRRFFAQQFKRSCAPDGVKVGSVSLSPRGDWRMPSDASAALWLEETEKL